jgi:hypothetical protein
MKPRFLCLVIGLGMLSMNSFSQHHLQYDSSEVHPRSISREKLNEYRADPAFQYYRESMPDSPWELFWRRFWERVARLLGHTKSLTWIEILVAAAVLVFFMYQFSGMNRRGLFAKRNLDAALGYELGLLPGDAVDLEEAIRHAVAFRDFRLALRLLYLQTLKRLSEDGWIRWQSAKTNSVYGHELAGSGFQGAFLGLTDEFEASWYGELPVDQPSYEAAADRFRQFQRQIIPR